MAVLGAWGRRWLPAGEDLAIRVWLLEEGGPDLWERFMAELRAEHLGIPAEPAPDGKTVRERLNEACPAIPGRWAPDGEARSSRRERERVSRSRDTPTPWHSVNSVNEIPIFHIIHSVNSKDDLKV
ncbi:hypothetical protein [Streptosporangium roseum]|uniref:hypothetical protein n=1 Tax=Streptosporangium roseum TaxID=2001 RepID=UPI0018CC2DF3|nr:hypothetical protein [Streptosporangium roseum]